MYRAVHDPTSGAWQVYSPEGRPVTEPHVDEDFTKDRAEALNMGRQQRLEREHEGEQVE